MMPIVIAVTVICIMIEGLFDKKKEDLKSKAISFMKSVGAYEGNEILYKGLSIGGYVNTLLVFLLKGQLKVA